MGVANSRSVDGSGPEAAVLLIAIKKGEHLKALRLLRLMPASVETIPHSSKSTAVHSAVKRGYVNILQFLGELPSGRPEAATDATFQATGSRVSVGLPPSSAHGQAAASSRRPSRLSQHAERSHGGHGMDSGGRQLVGRDSWLNAVDRHGRTPLFTAVRYNRLEFVEGLVSLGADPWATDRATRGTALHLAALLGHAPLAAALLMSPVVGPDPRVALCNAQDMYGFTPLHYAAAAGHADVARVLLEAGASYVAASQLLYDPSPGLRRLTNLTNIASRAGIACGRGGTGDDRNGALAVPCAPRSNPLHLAALRGDGVMAMLLLQRYLVDTDGLTRAARERVTDPRTQLNKDGFQPYMLAGNSGHWHVAQLLIPHSRDDRHHLSHNRDRDFLGFFPLPDPAATAAGGGGGGGGGGPPSLSELAARAWAAKLLADVKSAEAAVRQLQHSQSYNHLTASPVSVGGGGGAASAAQDSVVRGAGGVLGVILRRSGRNVGVSLPGTNAAAAPAPSSNGSRRGVVALASPPSTAAASAAAASAAVAVVAAAVAGTGSVGGSCLLVGASPGASTGSTPRTSASGASCGVGGTGRAASPPRRSLLQLPFARRESRRTASLDLNLRDSVSGPSATAAPSPVPVPAPPSGWPLPSHPTWPASLIQPPTSATPGSPVTPASASGAAAAAAALCDVCFEQPQELALRPCPHRMCASCCRRVVEMHCAGVGPGGAAAAARAPGRPAAVPPRCPFCQATIRGFAPAAAGVAAVRQ